MITRATYQRATSQRATEARFPASAPAARQMSPYLRVVVGFMALFMVSAFAPDEKPDQTSTMAPFGAPLITDAPIAAAFVATADIALEGHWKGVFTINSSAEATATISIRRGQSRGRYVITIIGRDGESQDYAAHTSNLRGMKFLNIRFADRGTDNGASNAGQRSRARSGARYVLALYSISGSGTLSLRTMPAELVREAVISNQLPGRFWAANTESYAESYTEGLAGGQAAPELRRSDSVTLRRFLRKMGPARVFSGQWGRFRRAAPPKTPHTISPTITPTITPTMTHLASAAARR